MSNLKIKQMVRSSFSTLFFIRENRVRKDGTTIIEVLITVNGERCGFSTGKKVKATSWDKTKQQVKGKSQQLPESRKSQTVSERSGIVG